MAHHPDSPLDRKQLEAQFAWLFESTFLTQLDVAEQDLLLELMCWKRYAQDEVLVHAGDKAKGLELIVEGEAKVVVAAPVQATSLLAKLAGQADHAETVLVRMAPGHVYGERSLRTGAPANATVRALSPLLSLHLTAEGFQTAILRIPTFRRFIDDLVMLRDNSALIKDLLLRHPFLRLLGRDDMQRFIEAGRLVRVAAGSSVVRRGDRTTDVYVVVRGRVGVMGGEYPKRETIATKGPGWMFGHAAALLEVPRTADVDAIDAVELLSVPANAFVGLVTRNPTLYRQLYQELAVSGVTVGPAKPRKAAVVSVYGIRPGMGTTTVAWGLAASLLRELGAVQHPQAKWRNTRVVLLEMGQSDTMRDMALTAERIHIGQEACDELLAPPGTTWPLRILRPKDPEHALEIVHALQQELPANAWILLAMRSQTARQDRVMVEAESVVFVRGASDGSHDQAAQRHQYRIDAIRLDGGVLPLESAGRSVRIPADAPTLARFKSSGDMNLLSTDATIIGRACRRLARALLGKTVGLALGGGGALGFAHVGLIRALEEAKIPIDYIAGVSFGSLVAALYAGGRREALERLVAERWTLIPTLLSGFVSTKPFEWETRLKLGREVLMCETEIPFYPVGVDINTGREVVRAHGSVGHGVRSASCLPGAYPALNVGSQRVVDGGMHNNVPASVLWQAGAHFIIASNIIPDFPFAPPPQTGPMATLSRLGLNRMDEIMRSIFLLMSQSGRDRAQLADYVFDLDIRGYNVYDVAKGKEIAAAGYDQACRCMPDIESAWRNQATGVTSMADQSGTDERALATDELQLPAENH
jgi:NTE family protein